MQSQNNIALNKIVDNFLSNINFKLRFSQMSPKCLFDLICPVHDYTSYLIVMSLMSFNLSSIYFSWHWLIEEIRPIVLIRCPSSGYVWLLCHLACSSDVCISCKLRVDLKFDRLGKRFQFEYIMYGISYFILLYIRRPKIFGPSTTSDFIIDYRIKVMMNRFLHFTVKIFFSWPKTLMLILDFFVLFQDLVMDILRVLSTPDLEVRKKTLQLALDLVSSRNVEEVKQKSESSLSVVKPNVM